MNTEKTDSNLVANTTCASKEDWEMEDPNLLNIPELLYTACKKLPPPDSINTDENDEFWEGIKFIRVMISDQNFILDTISELEEIKAGHEATNQVLGTLITTYERDCRWIVEKHFGKLEKKVESEQAEDIWNQECTNDLKQWKEALDVFTENHMKIRGFIPKETEETEEDEWSDAENEILSQLLKMVQELSSFLTVFTKTK